MAGDTDGHAFRSDGDVNSASITAYLDSIFIFSSSARDMAMRSTEVSLVVLRAVSEIYGAGMCHQF